MGFVHSSARFLSASSVLFVALLGASGCGLVSTGGNEIGLATVTTRDCILSSPGSTRLFGDLMTPTTPVEILSVELNGGEALTVQGIYVLDPALGVPIRSWGDPPEGEQIWEERVEAVGAVLTEGETSNLVIQAEMPNELPVKVDSISVKYLVDGRTENATGRISYTFHEDCGL